MIYKTLKINYLFYIRCLSTSGVCKDLRIEKWRKKRIWTTQYAFISFLHTCLHQSCIGGVCKDLRIEKWRKKRIWTTQYAFISFLHTCLYQSCIGGVCKDLRIEKWRKKKIWTTQYAFISCKLAYISPVLVKVHPGCSADRIKL